MPKYVRLKSKATGAEFTAHADIPFGTDVTVIDKPATNADGKPLPPKYKTSLSTPAEDAPTTSVSVTEPAATPKATKADSTPKE